MNPNQPTNASEPIVCPTCKGNGRIEMLEHCPTCDAARNAAKQIVALAPFDTSEAARQFLENESDPSTYCLKVEQVEPIIIEAFASSAARSQATPTPQQIEQGGAGSSREGLREHDNSDYACRSCGKAPDDHGWIFHECLCPLRPGFANTNEYIEAADHRVKSSPPPTHQEAQAAGEELPEFLTMQELLTRINWIAADSLGRIFTDADKAKIEKLIDIWQNPISFLPVGVPFDRAQNAYVEANGERPTSNERWFLWVIRQWEQCQRTLKSHTPDGHNVTNAQFLQERERADAAEARLTPSHETERGEAQPRIDPPWLRKRIKAEVDTAISCRGVDQAEEIAAQLAEVEKLLEHANREPKHYVGNSWFVGDFVITFTDGKLEWRRQHKFQTCSMTGVAEDSGD